MSADEAGQQIAEIEARLQQAEKGAVRMYVINDSGEVYLSSYL